MNYNHPELRDRLAAAYALGTLRGLARRRLEKLIPQDAALSEAVERWQLRLNGLAEAMPPVEPPPHVWAKIEDAIGDPAAVIPFPAPKHRSPRQNAALWRGFGLAASAIAAMLIIYIGVTRPRTMPQNQTLAVLSDDTGRAIFVATASKNSRYIKIAAIAERSPAAGRVYQLWLLPKGGAKPRPIGLLPQARQASFTLPADDAEAFDGADGMAVSLESVGGSPTGLPTGPILFKGAVIVQQ